ncbi:MAG: hypothetical protein QM758_21825 [Armatimonas sp.]
MNRPAAPLVIRLHRATGLAILACQKMLERVPEEQQERYVVFHEQRYCCSFYDPVEADPDYTEILMEVNAKAKTSVENMLHDVDAAEDEFLKRMRWRHLDEYFWAIKKQLLSKTYGIDWSSPEELTRLMYRLRS